MMRYKILLITLLATASLSVFSQADDRKITNVQSIGIGASNILDTYLSPEKYNGLELRYISHTTRHLSDTWKEVFIHQGIYAYGTPRSEDNNEQLGMYIFDYGRYKLIKQTEFRHLSSP